MKLEDALKYFKLSPDYTLEDLNKVYAEKPKANRNVKMIETAYDVLKTNLNRKNIVSEEEQENLKKEMLDILEKYLDKCDLLQDHQLCMSFRPSISCAKSRVESISEATDLTADSLNNLRKELLELNGKIVKSFKEYYPEIQFELGSELDSIYELKEKLERAIPKNSLLNVLNTSVHTKYENVTDYEVLKPLIDSKISEFFVLRAMKNKEKAEKHIGELYNKIYFLFLDFANSKNVYADLQKNEVVLGSITLFNRVRELESKVGNPRHMYLIFQVEKEVKSATNGNLVQELLKILNRASSVALESSRNLEKSRDILDLSREVVQILSLYEAGFINFDDIFMLKDINYRDPNSLANTEIISFILNKELINPSNIYIKREPKNNDDFVYVSYQEGVCILNHVENYDKEVIGSISDINKQYISLKSYLLQAKYIGRKATSTYGDCSVLYELNDLCLALFNDGSFKLLKKDDINYIYIKEIEELSELNNINVILDMLLKQLQAKLVNVDSVKINKKLND